MNRTQEEADLLRAIRFLSIEVDLSIVNALEAKALAALKSVREHCAKVVSSHSEHKAFQQVAGKILGELK